MKASRRAILRASLAAPIVLTVTTAQAQTAASSAVACVRRDDLRAADPSLRPAQLLTVDGDDWLRTELSLVRIEQLIGVEWVLVDGEHFLGYGGSI